MEYTIKELWTTDNCLDVTVDVTGYDKHDHEVTFDIVSVIGGDDNGDTVQLNATALGDDDMEVLHGKVLTAHREALYEDYVSECGE